MNNLILDLKAALRALIRRPGFTGLAILTLAVGLGPTTAIFSMVNGVLLRPYPYEDPDRIVRVWSMNQPQSLFGRNLSYPDFLDFKAQTDLLDSMGLAQQTVFKVRLGDDPQPVSGARVSADLLPLVGATAAVGRLFSPEDDSWGAQPVAIVSHEYWQRQFNGAADVQGKVLEIDGIPHTVIGILAPQVKFPDQANLFIPLALDPNETPRDERRYMALGRLAPGVGVWPVVTQLDEIAGRLAETYPATNKDWSTWVMTLRDSRVNRYRNILGILGGVVAFVLLLACANVANLMLQRAAGAERELALRLALGSGRWPLVRRFLLEILIVAFVGGLLSLIFAHWVLKAVVTMLPFTLPSYMSFDFDPTVLFLLFATTVLTALISGLLPALRASKPTLVTSLNEAGGRSTGSAGQKRLRNTLVGLQVALSLMLLVGAGLMIRSFGNLQDVDPGFEVDGAVNFALDIPGDIEDEERHRLYKRVLERLGAIPGVQASGTASFVPMRGTYDSSVTVPGQSAGDGEFTPVAGVQLVDGDYFDALAIQTFKGRTFDRQELENGAKVAVINSKMEQLLWPGGEATGERIILGFEDDPTVEWTIVGVVEDMRRGGLAREVGLDVYLPFSSKPQGGQAFFVKAASSEQKLGSEIRSAVLEADPRLFVNSVQAMDEILYWSIWQERLARYLLSLFSLVALILAAVGLYGSLANNIQARHREIGVRMAMGADLGRVMKMIFSEAGRLLAIAMVVGLVGALLLGRVLSRLLYGVAPTDPVTLVGVIVVLLLVSAIAILVPAMRAGRVNPIQALRDD